MGFQNSSGLLVELASGIDALYLSGRALVPEGLVTSLEDSRVEARELARFPVTVGSEEFHHSGYGIHRFRYRLDHEHGVVGISPSKALPALWVQPRAKFIHAVGPRAVVAWFDKVLGREFGPIRWSVSRIDLHADFQGWELTGDDRSRFVTRASERDTHEDGEALKGFVFGRRTSGRINARIYDKTREIAHSGSLYWFEKWGDGYDPELPVTRVEFEIGRECLSEYGLQSPDEVLDAAGALWTACTTSWLRYCSPTKDQTRSRWPLAPEWESVQRVRFVDSEIGLEKVAQGLRRGELGTTVPSLIGWLARFGAIHDEESLGAVMTLLHLEVRRYSEQTRRSFSSRVAEKRRDMRYA